MHDAVNPLTVIITKGVMMTVNGLTMTVDRLPKGILVGFELARCVMLVHACSKWTVASRLVILHSVAEHQYRSHFTTHQQCRSPLHASLTMLNM